MINSQRLTYYYVRYLKKHNINGQTAHWCSLKKRWLPTLYSHSSHCG